MYLLLGDHGYPGLRGVRGERGQKGNHISGVLSLLQY